MVLYNYTFDNLTIVCDSRCGQPNGQRLSNSPTITRSIQSKVSNLSLKAAAVQIINFIYYIKLTVSYPEICLEKVQASPLPLYYTNHNSKEIFFSSFRIISTKLIILGSVSTAYCIIILYSMPIFRRGGSWKLVEEKLTPPTLN